MFLCRFRKNSRMLKTQLAVFFTSIELVIRLINFSGGENLKLLEKFRDKFIKNCNCHNVAKI